VIKLFPIRFTSVCSPVNQAGNRGIRSEKPCQIALNLIGTVFAAYGAR